MALSISTSNVLIGVVPTTTNPLAGEVLANLSDPDHSLNYTCGTSSLIFELGYGALTGISYVGISGHNSSDQQSCVVRIFDGGSLIAQKTITRNNNLMFTFPERDFTDLRVSILSFPTAYQSTISFIAAGKHMEIESGEQAGYNRNWLERPITQTTTTNLAAAPVSTNQKRKVLKGTLSLPNETAGFSQGDWQDFIDFAFEQPVFIKEVASNPASSYTCFDPVFNTNAHGRTLALDSIKLKFNVFNGL